MHVMYVCMYICNVCMHKYVRTYVRMHVCMYVCMCMHVCMYVCMMCSQPLLEWSDPGGGCITWPEFSSVCGSTDAPEDASMLNLIDSYMSSRDMGCSFVYTSQLASMVMAGADQKEAADELQYTAAACLQFSMLALARRRRACVVVANARAVRAFTLKLQAMVCLWRRRAVVQTQLRAGMRSLRAWHALTASVCY